MLAGLQRGDRDWRVHVKRGGDEHRLDILAVEQGPKVEWVREARWVEDGKFATSSGVSAGIDLALRLIEKTSGTEAAERVATGMEYDWHRDPSWDPLASVWKLV